MNASNRGKDSVDQLRIHAPAKINLHLEILGLRADGFHELAMVMQSIDLADQLEITSNNDGLIKLSIDDPNLSAGEDNLIFRAAELLRCSYGNKNLGANIYLQKNIPIGAGLAGGSTDAAATLVGLNTLWKLDLDKQKLSNLATELGSDIPFCLEGGTQLCFGRGEKLEPVKASASSSAMAIILVKDPTVSVSTPWAYGRSKEINEKNYLKSDLAFEDRRQLLREQSWLSSFSPSDPPPLNNDLQKVVAPEVQVVQNALKALSDLPGSIGVAMSGSGPSCFALYSTYKQAKEVLARSRIKLESLGFKSWCCSFQSEGVRLDQ